MIPSLHTWVTRRTLAEFGASRAVQRVVGETVRWPDWHWWANNASHASTPADANGQPSNVEQARHAAVARCQEYIQHLRRASSPDEQFIWLGAAFHWVQDLAVHQGRTNPEHSWQSSLLLPNPDWSPSGIRRGLNYSRELLQTLQSKFGEDWTRRLQDPHATLPSPQIQTRLLGERTFRWRVLWDFGLVGWRVGRTAPRVRWDSDATLHQTISSSAAPTTR